MRAPSPGARGLAPNLPIGEVKSPDSSLRSRMTREKNLRAKWRPRHFAIITGCRGHPCPRKRETHGGFRSNYVPLSMSAADTIVAPATAPGLGAVAIVRLSGPRAFEILEAIFHPAHSAELTPRMMRLGDVVDPATGARIDRALAVVMPHPASLTGEDVAEIQCHGGPFVVRRIVAIAVDAGARVAGPGRITRRPVLQCRADLAAAG